MLLVRGITKLILDGFMFVLFYKAFTFLVNMKQKNLLENEVTNFTTYNRAVIMAT